VCEYSPSQQHFLIIGHTSNNKGIIRVFLLRNTTICFHIKKNPNLSSKGFNDFVIVYVYCSLCRCSDVAKGYRVEDQALEMDRKVGDSFWSTQEGGEKQTNKKGFTPLGNLTCFALMLKIQLLIKKSKKNAIKS
jgi:hypothetical protein